MHPTPPPMLIETQRGTVNAWQCDDNEHLNFQYFAREFDQAARILALQAGADASAPLPATRHLRLHAELLAGDIFRIASARIVDGRHAGSVVHWMSDAGTGKLIATALDGGTQAFECSVVAEAVVAAALPRSVDTAEIALPYVAMGLDGWQAMARCWITNDRCDAAGEFTEQSIAGLLVDGVGHVWERAGVGVVWLREHDMGWIAVEAKLSHFAPARAGEVLMVHSRIGSTQGKSVHLQHHLHRVIDGAPIARADVTALLIDMKTRKTVALPDLAGAV